MVRLHSQSSERAAVRAPVLVGVVALVGICILAFILLRPKPEPAGTVPAPAPAADPGAQPVAVVPERPDSPPPVAQQTAPPTNLAAVVPSRTGASNPPAASGVALPAASGFTQQLVKQLSEVGLDGGPMTPEKAEAWKQNLQRLIGEGEKGLPAIRDFLARNEDLNLSALEGGDLLGQPTLRMALLDAMWQIGGQGAMDLSVQTLQTASDPREIAALAAYLEQQAPEQYRGLAVNAARESLSMASAGQLGNRDVGPLFSVLSQYGGEGVLPDLQSAMGQWKYYSAISIAALPENQGLPTLLQLAQDPTHPTASSRLVALEMLAQKAPTSQPALDALLQQAAGGGIPDPTMLTIASVMEGHAFGIGEVPAHLQNPVSSNIKRFHLAYGNQNYYSVVPSGEWSPEQVGTRIAIIDQLLATNPSDLARRALQQARTSLSNRIAQ